MAKDVTKMINNDDWNERVAKLENPQMDELTDDEIEEMIRKRKEELLGADLANTPMMFFGNLPGLGD